MDKVPWLIKLWGMTPGGMMMKGVAKGGAGLFAKASKDLEAGTEWASSMTSALAGDARRWAADARPVYGPSLPAFGPPEPEKLNPKAQEMVDRAKRSASPPPPARGNAGGAAGIGPFHLSVTVNGTPTPADAEKAGNQAKRMIQDSILQHAEGNRRPTRLVPQYLQ